MAFDGTASRADITYLRRRTKREAPATVPPPAPAAPPAAAATPAAAAPPSGGGLSLSPPGGAPAPGGLSLSPAGGAPTPPTAPAQSAPTPAPPSAAPGSLNLSPPGGGAPSGSLNLAPPGASAPSGSLNLTPPGAAPPATPQPATPPPPPRTASGGLSLSHAGRPPIGTPPGGTPPAPPQPSAPAAGGSSLNLSAPATSQAQAPASSAGGSSLDLSPPPAAAPATQVPAASGSSLSLGGATQPAARQAPPKPPSRRVHGRVLLSADEPTATLDRRQSALGSLVFEIVGPGAVAALWEMPDGTTGLVDEAERTRISPEFGRRPIVELHQTHVVVGLRHVQQLRRLLILMNGFNGTEPQRLLATLHDDATFETTHTGTGPYVAALAIYHVDGELVVRREGFGFDSADAIASAYGFNRNWLPPVHRPG